MAHHPPRCMRLASASDIFEGFCIGEVKKLRFDGRWQVRKGEMHGGSESVCDTVRIIATNSYSSPVKANKNPCTKHNIRVRRSGFFNYPSLPSYLNIPATYPSHRIEVTPTPMSDISRDPPS